jgi:two-component system CheB/CheR fusion protein
MRPEDIESLFGLFVQGHQSLARSHGGLGIGLALVKKLVEMHGGSIEARSAGLGKGSRFTIQFPLRRSLRKPINEPVVEDAPGSARRVLVIEDNADIRETMGMLLGALGHDVVLAADGGEGLDRFATGSPDVVLIDIGLPDIDGYEVAASIRRQHRPNVRLVALTGYGQEADKTAAKNAGFDMHLLKPVDPKVLERVLAQ